MPSSRGPSPMGRRGISPFRNGRGISPFERVRGLSPFQRRSRSSSIDSKGSSSSSEYEDNSIIHHHHHNHHTVRNSKSQSSVVVCHPSARSIVFRDSLRRATRMIEEVEREEDEEEENGFDQGFDKISDHLGEDEDEEDENDDSSSSSLIMPSGMSASKRLSVSQSRRVASEILQQEIQVLAEEMVPEEVDILTSLRENQYMSEREFEIEGEDHLHLKPLPPLERSPDESFDPLMDSGEEPLKNWTPEERHVYELMKQQRACVKTIKNSEWPTFLNRFQEPDPSKVAPELASSIKTSVTSSAIHASTLCSSSVGCSAASIVHSSTTSVATSLRRKFPTQHDDIPPHDNLKLNSFVTSTSLLPSLGRKMKSYGSVNAYPCGVIFALPDPSEHETEEEAVQRTETWAWPAGYAAKTEHNIDYRTGKLTNGRKEALVSLDTIRQHNRDYLEKDDHVIGGKLVRGGFSVIPYNEIFLRVGGTSIKLSGTQENEAPRSFDHGCGMFVALFVRTATIRDLMALLRTRARVGHILGEEYTSSMPLLFMSHENGVRVFSQELQQRFFKMLSKVSPFQNPSLEPRIKFDGSSQICLQQKLEELLDIHGSLRQVLTPEACARIAGGYGCTDETVADVLKEARIADEKRVGNGHRLQDVVVEGMAYAVRSSDFFTARQLLILYTLVSSEESLLSPEDEKERLRCSLHDSATLFSDLTLLDAESSNKLVAKSDTVQPPPPLDTDRLRRATSSFGLLSVFGAAQILGAMRDGGARTRTEESIEAVEEWVKYGEGSLKFRLASWRDQRADEQNVALESDSKFMAFASGKAITNRKRFAEQLKSAVAQTDFSGIQFLRTINDVLASMHSPCLRLEILHFILGLDNRYSVCHVQKSIELAATCLSVASASKDSEQVSCK